MSNPDWYHVPNKDERMYEYSGSMIIMDGWNCPKILRRDGSYTTIVIQSLDKPGEKC